MRKSNIVIVFNLYRFWAPSIVFFSDPPAVAASCHCCLLPLLPAAGCAADTVVMCHSYRTHPSTARNSGVKSADSAAGPPAFSAFTRFAGIPPIPCVESLFFAWNPSRSSTPTVISTKWPRSGFESSLFYVSSQLLFRRFY